MKDFYKGKVFHSVIFFIDLFNLCETFLMAPELRCHGYESGQQVSQGIFLDHLLAPPTSLGN